MPLSKRMVQFKSIERLSGDKEVTGNGISITVPKKRTFVEGSACSTHVPQGVLLFYMGIVVSKQAAEIPVSYLMLSYMDVGRR